MDDFDIDIRGLLGMLRRQARLIIITAIAVVGITALVTFSLTPIYTGSALVLVDTNQKNLLSSDFAIGGPGTDDARVESELIIIKSKATLLKVIERLDLVSNPEFGVKLGLTDRVLAFLQIAKPTLPTGEEALQRVLSQLDGALNARRQGYTNVISLEVESESRQLAADIANAWADAYIENQVSAKIDSTIASRDILAGRLEESRQAVVEFEGALDDFINVNLGQIIGDTGRTDIADIRQRLEETSAQRTRAAARAELAETSLQQRDWAALAQTLGSSALQELERQRAELTTAIETAVDDRAVALRDELSRIEQQLVDAAAGELTTLRENVNIDQAREGELRQQLRTTVLSSALSPSMLADIYELQQKAELARQQYQTLLARIQDFDTQANLQIADSRVVSPALPPGGKSFPNTTLSLVLATIIGVGLGVVLAFLNEHLIGGLLTEDQTEAVLHVPVAAAIPRQRSSELTDARDGGSVADLMVSAPLSTFAEAVRRIRVVIERATGSGRLAGAPRPNAAPRGAVLMVTSSTANEGKSTLALSLARTLALSKKRVLIIDSDLRKPSLAKMANLPPSNELIEMLVADPGAGDFTPLVRQDPLSNVRMIASSEPSETPTDQLIASETFAQLLEASRKAFDVVILDTPPVGPVVDALYLAPVADLILYVVRSSSTSQIEARMALGTVLKAKGEHTQVYAVLNQQERASASYKSKYEAYYYYNN